MNPLFLRTPEECFVNTLKEFPFRPMYIENMCGKNNNLRMAYYDIPCSATAADAVQNDASSSSSSVPVPVPVPVFVCLHGEPSWSYLYRHMVPIFRQHGRVLCFDLIGFGRSDKPTCRDIYTFTFHRNCLLKAIHQHLDLHNITLVVQDWGGILGLTLPLEDPNRYSRLIIMNTLLPIEPETYQIALDVKDYYGNRNNISSSVAAKPKSGFGKWLAYSQSSDDMNIGKLVGSGCYPNRLSKEDMAAYNAPFPTKEYKVGALVFPTLVPLHENMDGYNIGRQALCLYQHNWKMKPTYFAVGAKDNVIPLKLMKRLASYFGDASNDNAIRQNNRMWFIHDGNHFIQEHYGAHIAKKALQYFDSLMDLKTKTTMNSNKWQQQQKQHLSKL